MRSQLPVVRLASICAAFVLLGCGSSDSEHLFSDDTPGAGGDATAAGGTGGNDTGSGGSLSKGGAGGVGALPEGGASSGGTPRSPDGGSTGGSPNSDAGNDSGDTSTGADGSASDSGVPIEGATPVTFPSGGVISEECADCVTASCQSEASTCAAEQDCWGMGLCITKCFIPLQCAACFVGPEPARAAFSSLQCCAQANCAMCPSLGGLLACP